VGLGSRNRKRGGRVVYVRKFRGGMIVRQWFVVLGVGLGCANEEISAAGGAAGDAGVGV